MKQAGKGSYVIKKQPVMVLITVLLKSTESVKRPTDAFVIQDL